jgi:transposase
MLPFLCYNLKMLIREVVKKNPGYDKQFVYHHLVESIRTPKGPRQRLILNLGKLDIPKDEWKLLANRIEEIIAGQMNFLEVPIHIESLAKHYADMIVKKQLASLPPGVLKDDKEEKKEIETVNLSSLSTSRSRTVGGESIGHYAFEKLGFPGILRKVGFDDEQINQSELLIIGRLLHPASERETLRWGKDASGLDEVIGADFGNISNNALYRISDKLIEHRQEIERSLREKEKHLLGLNEKIILYDLTNTYFEGCALGSDKAKRGRSKEKRSDCPLLTLALVLDEDGFPKCSKVFDGNVSEPGTLASIIKNFKNDDKCQLELFDNEPTIVMDAGIATEENLKLLKNNKFHYICVSRTRPDKIPDEGLVEFSPDDSGTKVSLKKIEKDGEVFLFCQSPGRKLKEESMKGSFVKSFEEGLKSIESSLKKPRGHKKYKDIAERIGRLKQKYSMIARYYQIDVKKEDDFGENVESITWKLEKSDELALRFAGTYYIRSDRTDFSEIELWKLYMMLTQVEGAFRCLKSELGLRPNYHQKGDRMEGHLFITVLAYHLLALLGRELRNNGIHHRWETIRNIMSTHTRVTASIDTIDNRKVHIRNTLEPEYMHIEIYNALNLSLKPVRTKKVFL